MVIQDLRVSVKRYNFVLVKSNERVRYRNFSAHLRDFVMNMTMKIAHYNINMYYKTFLLLLFLCLRAKVFVSSAVASSYLLGIFPFCCWAVIRNAIVVLVK